MIAQSLRSQGFDSDYARYTATLTPLWVQLHSLACNYLTYPVSPIGWHMNYTRRQKATLCPVVIYDWFRRCAHNQLTAPEPRRWVYLLDDKSAVSVQFQPADEFYWIFPSTQSVARIPPKMHEGSVRFASFFFQFFDLLRVSTQWLGFDISGHWEVTNLTEHLVSGFFHQSLMACWFTRQRHKVDFTKPNHSRRIQLSHCIAFSIF